MKKYLESCQFLVIGLLAISLCFGFASCGSDEDEDNQIVPSADTGKDNTTDMAVTGGVVSVSQFSAIVNGYINLDQSLVLLVQDFGVEYSTSSDFKNSFYSKVPGYSGREFTVELFLRPNKTYYYRTYIHQISGAYVYGKTMSFNSSTVSLDITPSYSQATIEGNGADLQSEDGHLYLSTSKDGPFEVYKYYGDDYWYNNKWVVQNMWLNITTIKGLRPGKTYYCYYEWDRGGSDNWKTDIVSFTTNSLDLSGVKVDHKYTPTYQSYVNQWGSTVDVSWVMGTHTFNITSNLGSDYKYGVFLILGNYKDKDYDLFKREFKGIEEYLRYPKGNNHNSFELSVDQSGPYGVGRISTLIERALNGEAGYDEYKELELLLDEAKAKSAGSNLNISVFVEINGERIYIEDYHF